MFIQLFGQYLLNKDLISRRELINILRLKKSVRPKLGILAINEGFMTAKEVEEVHSIQTEVDKWFGEIAIELGYLTHEKLEKLLSTQTKEHLLLSQALIDNNYFTLEQYEKEIKNFKRENSLSDLEFNEVKNNNVKKIVEALLNFDSSLDRGIYDDYFTLLIKNLIRFIDDNISFYDSKVVAKYKFDWLVYQEIIGENNLFTGISANEDVFMELASRYSKQKYISVDRYCQDSLGEFLNIHNGLFMINMSNSGHHYNLRPQGIKSNNFISDIDRPAYIVPFYTPFGSFDFVFSKNLRIN